VIAICGKWTFPTAELFVLREGIFAVRNALMGMLEQLLLRVRKWSLCHGLTKGPIYSFIYIQRRWASRHSLLNLRGT
jgi:hypothetical protein